MNQSKNTHELVLNSFVNLQIDLDLLFELFRDFAVEFTVGSLTEPWIVRLCLIWNKLELLWCVVYVCETYVLYIILYSNFTYWYVHVM